MLSLAMLVLLAGTPRDASFWRELAANHFPLPEGASPGDLLLETSAFLGSPYPGLRDGVG